MLKKFFSHTESSLVKPLVVVSGLPRSGTSMMMKMLAEGGLDILSDSFRTADEDNPNGYFEIERSKNLRDGDKTWLKNAQGKAVKVISYLLEFLPDDFCTSIAEFLRLPLNIHAMKSVPDHALYRNRS